MSKKYYEENKEKILNYAKEYRKNHKGVAREYMKLYRENNIDSLTTKKKEYYSKNRQEILKKKKTYNKEHSEERREFQRVKKFGITNIQYKDLLIKQNDVCAICLKSETAVDPRTNLKMNLAIDHNHVNGEIRGLLCTKCNRGLGYFQDDSSLLNKAKDYLENYKL